MFGDLYTDKLCSIRFPDPAIKVNDTVKINLSTGTFGENMSER